MYAQELDRNALYRALRNRTFLTSVVTRHQPIEALFLPIQSRLEEIGIAPYLEAIAISPKCKESATHSSDLSAPVNGKEASKYNSLSNGAITRAVRELEQCSPKNFEQFRKVMTSFVLYHVVHFDDKAASSFTTAHGHRGQFSETLDSIARFGRIGGTSVIEHIAPQKTYNTNGDWEVEKAIGNMNVFLVADVFMDSTELKRTTTELSKALLPSSSSSSGSSGSAVLGTITGKTSIPCEPTDRPVTSAATTSSPTTSAAPQSNPRIREYRRRVAADNEIGFADFQILMQHSDSSLIAEVVSQFVTRRQIRGGAIKSAEALHKLIAACMEECETNKVWEGKQVLAAEGLEKYITSKLYLQMFGVDREEREKNKQLSSKLAMLSVTVRADHLDACDGLESLPEWPRAVFELEGMNYFKSPREKMTCGLRATQWLTRALTTIMEREAAKKREKKLREQKDGADKTAQQEHISFGADEFLPSFMLLVCRANPTNFYLNVNYIARFRYEASMQPEEAYTLATLQSAAEFWLNCTASALRFDRNAFQAILSGNYVRSLDEQQQRSLTNSVTSSSVSPVAYKDDSAESKPATQLLQSAASTAAKSSTAGTFPELMFLSSEPSSQPTQTNTETIGDQPTAPVHYDIDDFYSTEGTTAAYHPPQHYVEDLSGKDASPVDGVKQKHHFDPSSTAVTTFLEESSDTTRRKDVHETWGGGDANASPTSLFQNDDEDDAFQDFQAAPRACDVQSKPRSRSSAAFDSAAHDRDSDSVSSFTCANRTYTPADFSPVFSKVDLQTVLERCGTHHGSFAAVHAASDFHDDDPNPNALKSCGETDVERVISHVCTSSPLEDPPFDALTMKDVRAMYNEVVRLRRLERVLRALAK